MSCSPVSKGSAKVLASSTVLLVSTVSLLRSYTVGVKLVYAGSSASGLADVSSRVVYKLVKLVLILSKAETTVSPVWVFGPLPRFIVCCVPGNTAYRASKLAIILTNAALTESPPTAVTASPRSIRLAG